MKEVLVSINKNSNIVTIFYNGSKLIKGTNEFQDMNEEEIKQKFIKELNIK